MKEKILIAGQEGMVGNGLYKLFEKKKNSELLIVKEKI